MEAPPPKIDMGSPPPSVASRLPTLKKLAELLGNINGNSAESIAQMFDANDQDIVLTVPSLTLKVPQGNTASSLPKIGEHNSKSTKMASVLSQIPQQKEEVANNEACHSHLNRRTCWTRSTVDYASQAIANNISESFTSLLNSRIRAWTLVLLKHSLSTGNHESRERLLSVLKAKIHVTKIDTKFQTLHFPEAERGVKPKGADVVLPLLLEAVLKVSIQAKEETVTLRAPGTISAIFKGDSFSSVAVKIDAKSMLKSIVEEARLAVIKAVAKATKTPIPKPSKELPKKSVGSSSVSLISTATSNGPRKIRSVTWDKPSQTPKFLTPDRKKLRMIQTAAKLKSFRSFGRPHAGDFGSGPRNATFGDYGSSGSWGRDGRMTHHPTPFLTTSASTLGVPILPQDKNAVFDTQRKSFGSTGDPNIAKAGAAFLRRTNTSVEPEIPLHLQRTPTALENSLMKSLRK